jgi:hypothetical protein
VCVSASVAAMYVRMYVCMHACTTYYSSTCVSASVAALLGAPAMYLASSYCYISSVLMLLYTCPHPAGLRPLQPLQPLVVPAQIQRQLLRARVHVMLLVFLAAGSPANMSGARKEAC